MMFMKEREVSLDDGFAQFAEVVQRVDAGGVAVGEVDAVGVVADGPHAGDLQRLSLLGSDDGQQFGGGFRRSVESFDDRLGNGRSASLFAARGTGTPLAEQSPREVMRDPVVPRDVQGLVVALECEELGRCGFTHHVGRFLFGISSAEHEHGTVGMTNDCLSD